MTIEEQLADVEKRIAEDIRLSHINGIDYSWKGRSKRWHLSHLRDSLVLALERTKYPSPSQKFCRNTAKK